MRRIGFGDYKGVLYRNQSDGWVAEIPSIAGCHALIPTAEDALAELAAVFRLIDEEHRESVPVQREMERERFPLV